MQDRCSRGEPLLFGYAERKINPAVPVSLAGYFNVRMWESVLDDIRVQALVLKQGGTMTAIVLFDLIDIPGEFVQALRSSISGIEGLDPQMVLFTATHTHTAPDIRIAEEGSNAEYNAFAVAQASAATREAVESLQSGVLLCGRASDDRFVFNRRYWMKSGKVLTNPPRQHPDIVRPEGPIDPEIGLVGLEADGRLAVLLTNVVNHADTIGGCGLSADWPGFLRSRLAKSLGSHTAVMPLMGAAGNINHFEIHSLHNQTNYEEARRIGEGYAETIEGAVPHLAQCTCQELRVERATFTTGPREISPEELAEAQKHAQEYRFITDHDLTAEDLAKEAPAALKYFADRVLALAADRRERHYEVIAMILGDALLVSLPGEPFVEIGLRIKNELAAGRLTLVVSHGNGMAGYIPSLRNFEAGGYETRPSASPNSVHTAELLIAAVKEAVGRLLPDAPGTNASI